MQPTRKLQENDPNSCICPLGCGCRFALAPYYSLSICEILSRGMLYELFGQLGRLREGTWLRKSAPKLQGIDFLEKIHEIL